MTPRTLIFVGLVALALATAAPFAAAAPKNGNNAGTIKVHDDATATPETRNEPHVSCDFWIEGFNMQDSSGVLTFQAWPPTGNKQTVTPTGAGLDWSADSGNSHGNYHFLNGAYQLPAGHYKVTAQNENGTKTKSKVFWVDPCEQTPPPCTESCQPPPCTVDCTPPPCTQDCTPPTTQIPFFPSTGSLVMGVLGAAGSVGAIVLRRRT
jgi:hypothetical protein